jgi:CheY-like chemotaxis protein
MVDDNRSGLAARKAILEESGHSVTSATRTEDALDLFSSAPFDLVITDHRLTRLNGLALIRQIREAGHGLPIILLSSLVDALGLTESTTGADVVLPKSANELNHLTRAVAMLMRPRAKRKPPRSQGSVPRAKRQHA